MRRFLDARAERAAGHARAKQPEGLARRASGTNATNESGGEAEIAGGVGAAGALDAKFAERSRGGSQRSAAEGSNDVTASQKVILIRLILRRLSRKLRRGSGSHRFLTQCAYLPNLRTLLRS